MAADPTASCVDFARRLGGFLDGEMDSASLRAMALHASHCEACGVELGRGERMHQLLEGAVEREVSRLDPSTLWSRVANEIAAEPRVRPTLAALRRRFRPQRWLAPAPMLVVGGAIAALLVAILWPETAPSGPLAIANNRAQIERIESTAPQVAVWSEPIENTTAIWVASYEPEGAP